MSLTTPNLRYLAHDEDGQLRPYKDVDAAVSVAARAALRSEKTTSVYVYTKGYRPGEPPVSVIYVKVTVAPWE